MKLPIVCLVVFLLLTACGTPHMPWRAEYFSKVVNTAIQDDVAKRLGPPTATHKLDSGESVWQYRYYGSSVVGTGGNVVGGTDCTEYILTFDSQRVLRNWIRQQC